MKHHSLITRAVPVLLFMLALAVDTAAGVPEAKDVSASQPPAPRDAHVAAMQAVVGTPKTIIKSIGILVYDGVNILDVTGPRYVLGQIMGAKTQLISTKPGHIKTVIGVELVPDTTIDRVEALDILVIPGGFAETLKNVYNRELHDWIRKIDKTTTYTASVCSGGWILAGTGLLKGRKATTNWYRAEQMLTRYGVDFTGERFTRDGKYWTSAGVTAGMDMSLAIVNDIWGEKYTQGVMLDMEYDPAPPVRGGSIEKTDKDVLQMMTQMYDMGFLPIIEQLEKNEPL
ncbi:DJ-1/PfpI family protein [Exilibacterium tricleocarpae]|uniref:DJ-1/PfpI family protein n=1 Tax=Exilibacterium tricleocarpae TaxID=2591008 RepID=A0A545T0K0_9GAMM|nr:DJ-1/PfpI family protein [Exilibacterium tricleocarpae]TQV70745.1 DJ-1/PfpI family protein [Exilibacterium tricleocarpae]